MKSHLRLTVNQTWRSLFPAVMLVFLLWQTGCVALEQNPVSGTTRAFAYTWEQEIQIGRDVDQEIVAEFGIYDNPELEAYIVELSELILAQSHLRRPDAPAQFRNTEFTFRLLDSDVVNAFALPGGFVYFTRGLLSHMNNEAQLAVVIGHEIGHVAARHASQRMLQQQIGQMVLVGGAIAGQELFGVSAENIMNLGGTAAQLLFLSHSRDHERESDRLGVEYAAKAGFDASEGSAFFRSLQRLSAQHGGGIPTFMSSHPDPGQREQSMHTLSQQWRDQGFEQTRRNERRFMEMIDGMSIGENPRNGFVRDGTFYHPDLAFQYPVPSGWNVQNMPNQVVMFDGDQQGISIFTIASDASNARQAVDQFTGQDGITVESSGTQNVGSIRGYRAIATAATQDGTELKIMIQGLEHNGNVYRFLNYSPAARYESYESAFAQIVNGFRTLTDQSILSIQPTRLQIVTADRVGPFSSFLPGQLPPGFTAESFAIMNQVELDETITRGQRLKLPRP
ncbi:MAG: M48 family metalloprotease [Candidatus Cyclonatronum sp.]|uniref:M48 family metalloprotease n=1 Tax=Cyclonatronum sp. TaxID=3024185 RepID=UPI0025BBF1D7|nr:M48 family metalloprotease [Cyclonatronum sp.]MCH8485652.1 M48 family metalloprotease [Cyclonatronum sp.]